MFTGFASENTPAIQVWDFFRPYTGQSSVSLADDCAPIQVFRTGGASTAVNLYLPTAPIEGKQVTIVNQSYGANLQNIQVFSSDVSGNGTNAIPFYLGQSDSLVLVYSKNNINYGVNNGYMQTGWILLNKSSAASRSYYSAIVGGDTNSISGIYSFIGSGNNNAITSSHSAILGGLGGTASGIYSSLLGGFGNSASGSHSCVVGGGSNSASGDYSIVVGGQRGTTRSIIGNFVTPASNAPIQSAAGRQQLATLLLGRQTTDATPIVLASNTSAAGTTNQVILPNNSAYTFQGTCIAARTAAGDTSSWKFEGAIKRGANAASTALVAAVTPTVIAQDAGASTWVLAITADTTNGGITVTVTGQAATTIRWVAKIETTEVTF